MLILILALDMDIRIHPAETELLFICFYFKEIIPISEWLFLEQFRSKT